MDKDHSCLLCSRFSGCLNKGKAWNFVCSDFTRGKSLEELEYLLYSTSGNLPATQSPKSRISGVGRSGLDAALDSRDEMSKEENFVKETLDRILSNPGQQLDLRIDDGDFPRAPNFFTWVTGSKFLGSRIFAKQAQVGTVAFGEYCPHCSDVDFVRDIPTDFLEGVGATDRFLERVVMLEYGVCPKCGARKSELMKNGDLIEYKEIVFMCGQRSGKSKTTGFVGTYVTHSFLKLKNPPAYFGLLPNEQLVGTLVGLTFETCKSNIWNPMLSLFRGQSWFKEYHEMLRYYEDKYSEPIFDVKDELIKYRHRNLMLVPSGHNRHTLRGATRFFSGHDEAALGSSMKADAVKMNSAEVFTSLHNSHATLVEALAKLRNRGDDSAPVPMLVVAGSPMFVGDQMTKLIDASRGSKYSYGLKLATWEMNPDMPRHCEFIETCFATNPAAADRDFGANPPMSVNTFFNDDEAVRSMTTNVENAVRLVPKDVLAPTRKKYVSATPAFSFVPDGNERLLTLDAGLVNNSFAMTISRKSISGDGILDRKVIIEACCEIIPRPDAPVNFPSVLEDVLKPIVKAFNVTLVVADRWQSVHIIQDLEATMGIEYENMSLKYGAFILYREDIGLGQVKLPRSEVNMGSIPAMNSNYPTQFQNNPIAHLIFQHFTARDLNTSVGKGLGYTDDLLWTVALAHFVHSQEKYKNRFVGRAGAGRTRGLAALGGVGVGVRSGSSAASSKIAARPSGDRRGGGSGKSGLATRR